jgi:hypothetical protein
MRKLRKIILLFPKRNMGNRSARTDPILEKYQFAAYRQAAQGSAELITALHYNNDSAACDLRPAYDPKETIEQVESDIMHIVATYPDALNNQLGWMRCRYNITPFQLACYNTNISIEVVKWLLDRGASPNLFWNVGGPRERIHMFNDDTYPIPESRRLALEKILHAHPEYVHPPQKE